MQKLSLIFRCPKGLIAILSKFANMQKSADFGKWQEIWKAHFNWNMFLPYQAKNQPHFQVSGWTYGHFIKIRKYAKISWFLQMVGNLKSSNQLNMFLPYRAKNQPHFQVTARIYSPFIKIGKFCKFAKISWLLTKNWPKN